MKKGNSWAIAKLLLSASFFFSMSTDASATPKQWTKEELLERMKNPPHLKAKRELEELRDQAHAYSRVNNYEKAEQTWEKIVNNKYNILKDKIQDEIYLAYVYARARKYKEANAIFKQLIKNNKVEIGDLKNFLYYTDSLARDYPDPIEALKKTNYSQENIEFACEAVSKNFTVEIDDLERIKFIKGWINNSNRKTQVEDAR